MLKTGGRRDILDTLGSKKFSIIILKACVIYFAFLAILWFSGLIPPAPYMYWAPFSLWTVLFFINLSINLLTKKYLYNGNLVFHIALLAVLCGALTSALFRFKGDIVAIEGDTFWGNKEEYFKPPSFGLLKRSFPSLSFKLEEITPEFWKGALYFTKLEGRVKYPAETLDSEGIIRLNGGLSINGARLRLKNYGFFPEVVIEEEDMLVIRGPLRVVVFPPGVEDSIDIKNYRLYIKVLSDPVLEGNRIVNASMNMKEPLFLVRVEWFGKQIFKGTLMQGEAVRMGNISIRFTGLRKWAEVGVVKDHGEPLIFAGFVTGVTGLILRLYSLSKKQEA